MGITVRVGKRKDSVCTDRFPFLSLCSEDEGMREQKCGTKQIVEKLVCLCSATAMGMCLFCARNYYPLSRIQGAMLSTSRELEAIICQDYMVVDL